MDFIFGRRKKPEEIVRQNMRAISRAIRELEREKSRLDIQEKKVIADMKVMGKKGQIVFNRLNQDSVRIMAADLIKTRRYIKKFISVKANMQALSLKLQTMKSTADMSVAMKKALITMNKQMKLPAIQVIMRNFQQECETVDMKQEIMEEAIDEITGEEEDDQETEVLVNSVLDELGISVSNDIGALPTSAKKLQAENENVVNDLESRLEKLRRD